MKLFKRIILAILSVPMIIILLMIFYFALSAILNPWETKLTLEFRQKPESICFYDGLGFISVQKSPVDALVNKKNPSWKAWNSVKSLIIKTTDHGDTWVKIYSGTGNLPSLSYDRKNTSLYALIRLYDESYGFSSKIIRTTNFGEIWEKYLSYDNYIKGINFDNPLIPFMWSKNLIFFINNGNIIKTVKLQTPQNINDPVVDNKNNLWVSYNDTVAKVSQDGSVKVWTVKQGIKVDAMAWNRLTNELYLVGRSKNSSITRLLKQNGSGNYTEIKNFQALLADALLIQDDNILILGSSTKHGGFFGMGTLLFISKDNGKSWKKDRNYPVFARKPMFFNSDRTLWIYDAMGRIKVLDRF